MKFKIKKRYPNFFTMPTPETLEFDTLEEFYKIPVVKQWKNQENFSHFKIARSHRPQKILIVYLTDEKFWAIAWIWGPVEELDILKTK